jgi:L-seryl-tRNA(Ser) seleniumtransferase
VRPGTWSLQQHVDSGWIARPPRHGIGRSMKVGKDAIVGLLAALERYGARDHAAELAAWRSAIARVAEGLAGLPLQVTQLFPGPNGQPFPVLRIASGEGNDRLRVRELILALRRLPRKIILAEDERSPDVAFLYPMCLRPDEPDYIVVSIRGIAEKKRREGST